MPVAEAAELVIEDWRQQAAVGQVAESTVETHGKHLARLVKYAAAKNIKMVSDLTPNVLLSWQRAVNGYTGKPVPETTQDARRAVVSSFFHTCYRLGITDQNPAQALPVRTNRARYVHPFTPEEIQRLKDNAATKIQDTRTPAAVALVLLGCSSGEVGSIRCSDVHLTEMLVRAHGGSDRYKPRWLPIDDPWCFNALAARIKTIAKKHPDDWQRRTIAYTPNGGAPAEDYRRAAAATSRTITFALKGAGLKVNGETRVASITEYVAARVFAETGRVEAVAARLGLSNLDDAAHIVGYDWKSEYAQPGPPPPLGGSLDGDPGGDT
ncbi:MAG: hypothetical protein H6525_02320 [Actinobacteria bacterium]|nr:hypothetical protein [Actinomycetota bacterium]